MSEWATALKIGTTALVLELIERGAAPQLEIAQPVDATKSISRDQTYDWIIELTDGRKISAIDVQRIYLAAATKAVTQEQDKEVAWLLREWEAVLNDLDQDVQLCRDRVDWVAKKQLLEALLNEEQLSWTDPWLQSIDLEYHNIAPEAGLYYELLGQGTMGRFVTEAEIKHAIFSPPEDTRAYFRGRSVARFNSRIKSIQWDEIVFTNGASPQRVQLRQPHDNPRLAALNKAAREAADYRQFICAVAEL
jgi:proteasome accessory factor A